jgi:hypothetical protein
MAVVNASKVYLKNACFLKFSSKIRCIRYRIQSCRENLLGESDTFNSTESTLRFSTHKEVSGPSGFQRVLYPFTGKVFRKGHRQDSKPDTVSHHASGTSVQTWTPYGSAEFFCFLFCAGTEIKGHECAFMSFWGEYDELGRSSTRNKKLLSLLNTSKQH